ncbi:MAG: putative quinol monooxygenase [Aestuariibacter sp.]
MTSISKTASLLLWAGLYISICFPGMSLASEEDNMTYLKIDFSVQEKHLTEFMGIMRGLNSAMASEKGFVNASVFVDEDDATKITLIEAWTSRKVHMEHYDHIVADGTWAGVLLMLNDEPEMSYNRAVAVE